MSRKEVVKILYNGSHTNKNTKDLVPQGGPSRFARTFRNYFLKNKDFYLCPILFTHEDGSEPYLKRSGVGENVFNELVFDRDIIRSTYKKSFTRSSLVEYLKPFISKLSIFIEKENPDIVFLNGFSLTNWILLYVAHKHSIPVVIQHAGIWKKEIWRSRNAFSPSTRKILYDFERDTVRWCKHHIFLNNFSKKVFVDLYKNTWIKNKKSSIIPLPIDLPEKRFVRKDVVHKTPDHLMIGGVARWDSIKNHSAILRLASSKSLPEFWQIHVVTRIPYMSDFAKKYVKYVEVHPPVQPKDLEKFYEKMDIIFLPSNFDVSPTVVAESILAGTPVIISDQVGWQDEFVRCGLSDHIVPTRISGKKLINVINKVMLKRKVSNWKYALLQKFIRRNHKPSLVMNKYQQVFKLFVK
ncbi:MAG: glycosyltransferase family 4 protein [Minisyncoccota bacterium]